MNLSEIDNKDTRLFFRFRKPTLPYKSQYQPMELTTPNPYETYRNFKNKTHLPWLKLNLSNLEEDFPYQDILEEAFAVEKYSVPHRDSENSKGWKSLCIHGISSEKTQHASFYGYDDSNEIYNWTEISDLCPVTTSYFKNIFPRSFYHRVRFMYLEPGGFIAPHEDVINEPPHFTAINIALNQPEGCHFLMGDTAMSDPRRWGCVPFQKGGDTFWLDLRNYHSVINLSEETRVHIIVHSGLDEASLQEIKRFNRMLPSAQEELSEPMAEKRLHEHVIDSKTDSINVAIGILDLNEDQEENQTLEHYTNFTERFTPSMCSQNLFGTVKSNDVDSILEWAVENHKADYLLVLSSGTMIFEQESFWQSFKEELANPKNSSTAVWGHIIDRQGDRGMSFHTQTLVIDLRKYRKYGTSLFGKRDNTPRTVCGWLRSSEDVHDNYTPLFLEPTNSEIQLSKTYEGWNLIHDTLKAGYTIRNFNDEMRSSKIHGYPEDNHHILKDYVGAKLMDNPLPHPSLEEGQNTFLMHFKESIEEVSKTVWVHNNEKWQNLKNYNIPDLSFDVIAVPAAGGIDFSLFTQVTTKDKLKIIHYDISRPNLMFRQNLINNWTTDESFYHFLEKAKKELPPESVFAETVPLFEEQNYDLLRSQPEWELYKSLSHQFIDVDLLEDADPLLTQLIEGKRSLIYLSNIFDFYPWLWFYSDQEIHRIKKQFIQNVKSSCEDSVLLFQGSGGLIKY